MEKLLRVSEVANTFSVSEYTVRVWLKEGKLVGTKVNGHWRVTETAMLDYAEKMYGESNAS